MKVDMQRLAAAKALEWAQGRGAVSSVKVDGAAVALADAKQTLSEVQQRVAKEPGRIDRWVDKADGVMRGAEAKLSSQPVAKKVFDALAEDHERIFKQVEVQVAFDDGRTEKVTIEVVDIPASVLLNRTLAAVELVALAPLGIGQAVLGLSALSTQGAAKVAEWKGNPELAEALQRSALKQWVLWGVGWVPGVGSVTGALAAVRDWQQGREVAIGPVASVIAP